MNISRAIHLTVISALCLSTGSVWAQGKLSNSNTIPKFCNKPDRQYVQRILLDTKKTFSNQVHDQWILHVGASVTPPSPSKQPRQRTPLEGQQTSPSKGGGYYLKAIHPPEQQTSPSERGGYYLKAIHPLEQRDKPWRVQALPADPAGGDPLETNAMYNRPTSEGGLGWLVTQDNRCFSQAVNMLLLRECSSSHMDGSFPNFYSVQVEGVDDFVFFDVDGKTFRPFVVPDGDGDSASMRIILSDACHDTSRRSPPKARTRKKND